MGTVEPEPIVAPEGRARFLIGIGASAGGLEALELLLDGANADGQTAYAIVTHLSPDFKSILDELLRRHTSMTVHVVEDGMEVLSDVVYVIPPNAEMIVTEGRLHLSDRNRSSAHTLPINVFFGSLAQDYGTRAVGVILSGSGSDGAKGVKAIAEAGGKIIVQDPESAKFDSMPRAAINIGVDAEVVSANQIGESIAAHLVGTEYPIEVKQDQNEHDANGRVAFLNRILEHVNTQTGIDFSQYKITTVYRRIRRRIIIKNFELISEYHDFMVADDNEAHILAQDILIGVTGFFRDKGAFKFLADEIIPNLVAQASASKPLRIWTPACSSGQEVYSLAMLLFMEGRKQGKRIDPQIYATDLRQSAVSRAGTGVYSSDEIEGIPPEILNVCFEQTGPSQYQIIQPIRRWIVFAKHNLLKDPPFTRLDLISCRNALIYFEPEPQKKSLSLFNFGLRDAGILFLGRSESLGELEDDFEPVSMRWRVFKKTGAVAAMRLSLNHRVAVASPADYERPTYGGAGKSAQRQRLTAPYTSMMQALIPQGALVNLRREVIHIFGDADTYLRTPKGAMEVDVVKMAHPKLRVPLSTALERATNEKREIVFSRILPADEQSETDVTMRVIPLFSEINNDVISFFVGFESEKDTEVLTPPAVVFSAEALETDRIISLERELDQTRENLQATIEEVETSNEELQSTNEELMASNEELQSTNEELQSVNEEMYTVNGEYQKKNDELETVTRDIDNLLASTEIGVIFLDDDLCIRRFTEAVTRIFNISAIDIGRDLNDITHRLPDLDICDFIRETVDGRKVNAINTLGHDKTWWQVRVVPFAARSGHRDGAVVTFYDVSELVSAKTDVDARTQDLTLVADLTGARVVRHAVGGRFDSPQSGWNSLVGQKDAESLGFGWIKATHPQSQERLKEFWDTASAESKEPIQTHMRVLCADTDVYRYLTAISTPDFDQSGVHIGWISVLIDVDDAVQSEGIVRQREKMLDDILEAVPLRHAYLDRLGYVRHMNALFEEAYSLNGATVAGKEIRDVLKESDFERLDPLIQRALAGESALKTINHLNKFGDEEVVLVSCTPVHGAAGRVDGVVLAEQAIADVMNDVDENLRQTSFITHALSMSSLCVAHVSAPDATPDFVSSNLSSLTGFSVVELRQRTLPELLPEYTHDRLAQLIEDAHADVSKTIAFETFVITRSGGSIDVGLELIAVGGPDSSGAVIVMHDRSRSRLAESALRRRTEELSRSNTMLEVFAAAATHELTSPLRRVSKFSHLLSEDYASALDDEGREFLKTIEDETNRMRRTITSVLELTRLEKAKLQIKPLQINDMIDSLRVQLAEEIAAYGATIDVDLLPEIRGDAMQIEMLLRNLIVNAIVHGSAGRKPHVSIKPAKRTANMIQIAVKDNGDGVPEDRRAEIFMPFVRYSAEDEGIGMGLALCRKIAEAHGGSLVLEDSGAEGSVFIASLPLQV